MLTQSTYATDQKVARWYLDEARAIERDLADRMSAATTRHEQCDRREKQVQLAIDSDLFEELDTGAIDRVRELAASVRVQHRLLAKQVADAKRVADQCDEALTLHLAASRLDDRERVDQAYAQLEQLAGEIHSLDAETKPLFDILCQNADDQLSIFERMKR